MAVEIGPLAILAAAVAGLLFGALYYTALSKPWQSALGGGALSKRGGRAALPFVVAGAAQLIMAAVLAWFLAHGVGGPAEPAALDWFDGLRIGFLAWLGFVITSLAANHGFEGARHALTGIDGVHWLGVLLVQGLVLSLVAG